MPNFQQLSQHCIYSRIQRNKIFLFWTLIFCKHQTNFDSPFKKLYNKTENNTYTLAEKTPSLMFIANLWNFLLSNEFSQIIFWLSYSLQRFWSPKLCTYVICMYIICTTYDFFAQGWKSILFFWYWPLPKLLKS